MNNRIEREDAERRCDKVFRWHGETLKVKLRGSGRLGCFSTEDRLLVFAYRESDWEPEPHTSYEAFYSDLPESDDYYVIGTDEMRDRRHDKFGSEARTLFVLRRINREEAARWLSDHVASLRLDVKHSAPLLTAAVDRANDQMRERRTRGRRSRMEGASGTGIASSDAPHQHDRVEDRNDAYVLSPNSPADSYSPALLNAKFEVESLANALGIAKRSAQEKMHKLKVPNVGSARGGAPDKKALYLGKDLRKFLKEEEFKKVEAFYMNAMADPAS